MITTFFNGYLIGLFEVSKNIGVATYYGKMKPIIRCLSNDVHILAVARYGTVNAYIVSLNGHISHHHYELIIYFFFYFLSYI